MRHAQMFDFYKFRTLKSMEAASSELDHRTRGIGVYNLHKFAEIYDHVVGCPVSFLFLVINTFQG
jgi:hypothetical protein